MNLLRALVLAGLAFFRTRRRLAVEILALRHQLGVLKRSVKRPRLTNTDRGLWVLLSRQWPGSRDALVVVKPATVIKWHRAGFRRYWTWRSRTTGGRPAIDPEVRRLVKQMATANMWGAPRIHGELLKLGIQISVTSSPSAAWAANQIVQAFPWGSAPRYLLRDRDGIYGKQSRSRVQNLGIKDVIIARRSPWQSPYVERVIGTLRRELLDHVIVLNRCHLRRLLRRYVSEYYHPCRTHLSLAKDAPEPRAPELPESGEVIELPLVGGLHHRYARRVA